MLGCVVVWGLRAYWLAFSPGFGLRASGWIVLGLGVKIKSLGFKSSSIKTPGFPRRVNLRLKPWAPSMGP